MGLSRTVSEMNVDILQSVPKSLCLMLPLRWGSTWNFVTTVGPEKLRWCPYKTVKMCDDISIRLDALPAL